MAAAGCCVRDDIGSIRSKAFPVERSQLGRGGEEEGCNSGQDLPGGVWTGRIAMSATHRLHAGGFHGLGSDLQGRTPHGQRDQMCKAFLCGMQAYLGLLRHPVEAPFPSGMRTSPGGAAARGWVPLLLRLHCCSAAPAARSAAAAAAAGSRTARATPAPAPQSLMVPVDVDVFLIGFDGNGGYAHKTDPFDLLNLLNAGTNHHCPHSLESGAELGVCFQVGGRARLRGRLAGQRARKPAAASGASCGRPSSAVLANSRPCGCACRHPNYADQLPGHG